MKHLFILIPLLAFKISYGQIENKHEVSNAEKFSAKAGTLIQKEFIDVSRINKADVKVVRYTDLVSDESISAVRFEYEVVGSYSADTKVASLDADEIDGLLKSIKMMQQKVLSSTPINYTEVIYKSRGGFEAGCYWNKGTWSTYLKLMQNDGKSYLFLKKDDFPELVTLLEKVRTMMM
ncbi:hypothetical protein JMN32_16760 [Fulvivirga sp. 29W222]|uniref:Uncharacterized protein n=1 Tax=Fulvivirga marina TaxID=2494733 RepID=A0A937FXH2_9BACT|nr:hypothetical protein [Fulvivirga marina]MBL6447970.1 hypothetical protein [Fulvivirga marina]